MNISKDVTKRQKQYKHSYITKTRPSKGDSLQSWKLGSIYIPVDS